MKKIGAASYVRGVVASEVKRGVAEDHDAVRVPCVVGLKQQPII